MQPCPLDPLNAAATLCNGVGLLLTLRVCQKPDGRAFLYRKGELPTIARHDCSRRGLVVAGFIALSLAFVSQMAAQFVR